MALHASQLFLRFSGIKAWVALAVILSIALFGYYLAQGVRYWQASADVSDISQEIRSLERKINSLPQSDDSKPLTSSALERQLSRLEDLERLFNYPGTDALLAIVSSTAVDAGLELQSMRAEAPREEILHFSARQVRPVTVSAEAPGEETLDVPAYRVRPVTVSVGAPGEATPDVLAYQAQLVTISVEATGEATPDVLAYQVQPVSISMEGSPANLARFLTSLQQRVPVVSVPNLRIGGLDEVPTSKIQLLFYLNPHDIPEEENANAGSGDRDTG